MSGTASHGTYDSSPWRGGGEGGWGGIPSWVRQLDSKPVWIALIVLGFIHWWPVGLALLIFFIGSGRMGCGFGRRHGDWHVGQRHRWGCQGQGDTQPPAQQRSGNRAFDEYRADTLRRLEQEQQDFAAFLDRLRFARDKSEFDAFMAERRRPPEQPEPAPGA